MAFSEDGVARGAMGVDAIDYDGSGRLHLLGVTSGKRAPTLPDAAATAAESRPSQAAPAQTAMQGMKQSRLARISALNFSSSAADCNFGIG